jgi:FKBP-type peptidyl-prolyl cis-trans isomerase
MKLKKIALSALVATAVLQTPSVMAQQNGTKATPSKEKTSTADQGQTKDRFAYSYGVLLGDNLKSLGIDKESIDLQELLKGVQAVLDGDDNQQIDSKTAQQEVNNKIQELQRKLAAKKLKENEDFMAKNGKKAGMKTTASGIQYEILNTGSGEVSPTASNKVKTHYHGTLINGKVFDSSVDRGQPIDFPVTGVIQGWQEILKMMKVGDKWRVYIPPHLAYGSRPQGKIPANSILIFEMELLEIN